MNSTDNEINNNDFMSIMQQKMMEMLDYAYDVAITGLPGEKNVYELADDYLSKSQSREEAVNNLIGMQTTKAATSGFLTGLGGFITLPVAVPANVATVILFQVRMIATIAIIRGYDLKSDQVRTIVYTTLAGSSLADIVKGTGITIGNQLATSMLKKLPGKVLTKINQKVGFRLVTKFGQKGTVNLVKLIPVAGGIVGATFDVVSTLGVAEFAKNTFTEHGIHVGNGTYIIVDEE